MVDSDGDQEDLLLIHGKISRDEFNLDYRMPLNALIAFTVSLTAIGKKRVVGWNN